jgi:peptidoglycan-associated lipoprotein
MANMNAATSQPVTAATFSVDELNNPSSPLAKRSVYFDFDSYDVKGDYLPLLRAHADYLRSHRASTC